MKEKEVRRIHQGPRDGRNPATIPPAASDCLAESKEGEGGRGGEGVKKRNKFSGVRAFSEPKRGIFWRRWRVEDRGRSLGQRITGE